MAEFDVNFDNPAFSPEDGDDRDDDVPGTVDSTGGGRVQHQSPVPQGLHHQPGLLAPPSSHYNRSSSRQQ